MAEPNLKEIAREIISGAKAYGKTAANMARELGSSIVYKETWKQVAESQLFLYGLPTFKRRSEETIEEIIKMGSEENQIRSGVNRFTGHVLGLCTTGVQAAYLLDAGFRLSYHLSQGEPAPEGTLPAITAVVPVVTNASSLIYESVRNVREKLRQKQKGLEIKIQPDQDGV